MNGAGWLLMLFFISLAIAFRSRKLLKGLSFTVIIFAAVTLGHVSSGIFSDHGVDLN